MRQRSGEGVVRRNGCPKGCFWRVRFFSARLRFSLKHLKGPENLKGAEKKRTLQKHPFGQPFLRTTPSPFLWRSLNFSVSVMSFGRMVLRNYCLSGMFRRSASLAIAHLKSFAAIPSVSLVQLGRTNRNVFLSHESQRETDLV